ncbi:response regulator, partial [Oxalobacteraceae bacterium OM1]
IEPEELVANVKALLRLGRVERELREVARRKDIFLATLAHELRNPLAPILTAVELLGLLDPEAPVERERVRHTILRQTRHMIRLVDDLLDVSRITNGKIELRREQVELRSFVHAAIETAAAAIEQSHHVLDVELPQEDAWIAGDSVRLAQIVANLLNNAAKFTPPGGRIRLQAAVRDGSVTIAVSDNGIGFSSEQAIGIFELFVQAGHVPERVQEGLGIGLSLVKGLVELHGGSIQARSGGEGQGSTFEITLPLAPAQAPVAGLEAEASASPGEPHRILVVDDNIDGAEMIQALLEQQGHRVEVRHTALEAIEASGSFVPDIAILDIGLPDMSGLELAARLRAAHAGRRLMLIALTGYGRQDDKDSALGAGFDLHLTKPVSFEALDAAIARFTPAAAA